MEEIGSFVSIIRTDEARIEGIIVKVDLSNQRVAVKNARNFGSEGRKLRGAQIPPSLLLHGCITLGSRQIKDMEIILLSPQERNFPSLSQRRIGARNKVDGPSYSEIAKGKKN
ncbi:hypothetical protein Bca52824_088889 [Brassica carinata]|uniref:Lsm14-like N-terminal domain-containing protein n=1 Tax=Brassica carinata TaxID=52824 RepID=A0A8X7TR90_BRACI|nr:hypothetical protein Bca52824_088889 [Brassica carinata]